MWQNFNTPEFEDFIMYGSRLVRMKKNTVKEIKIPQGVTAIEEKAFSSYHSLETIEIPDSVTVIGNYAFYDCRSLHSVLGGHSVKNISSRLFHSVDSLQNIPAHFFEFLEPEMQSTVFNKMLQGWDNIGKKEQNSLITIINKNETLQELLCLSNAPSAISLYLKRNRNVELEDLDVYLKQAIAKQRTEVTAIYLEYRNKYYSKIQIEEHTKHNEMVEIGLEYPTFSEFSKKWTCSKKDGFVTISGYKGMETREMIPYQLEDGTPIKQLIYDKNRKDTYQMIDELCIDADLDECDIFIDNQWIKRVTLTAQTKYLPNFRSSKKLESVIIHDSITSTRRTFLGRSSPNFVQLPNSLTEIEDSTFVGCSALQSIVIPDSVTRIGANAFSGCHSLQSIVLPKSPIEIGKNAFFDCSSLRSVSISDSVTEIEGDALEGCRSLQSSAIPDSVSKIGRYAFRSCRSLQSVEIPDSVTEIGGYAFYACSSLKSISIPDSVTEIGRCAFLGCRSMQSINISDSVTEIGSFAFQECISLQSIMIPDSVTEIGGSAFHGCRSLQSIQGGRFLKNGTKNLFYSLRSLLDISVYLFKFLVTEKQRSILDLKLSIFDTLSPEEKDTLFTLIMMSNFEELLFFGNNPSVITYYLQEKKKIALDDLYEYLDHAIAKGRTQITAIYLEYKNNHYTTTQVKDYEIHKELLEMGLEYPTFSEFSKNWTCTLYSGTLTISGYHGRDVRVTIPDQLKDGTPIKCLISNDYHHNAYQKIEEWVIDADLEQADIFRRNQWIISVTMTEQMKHLPDFRHSNHLESIIIPSSIATIKRGNFLDCSSLTSVTIPDSVTVIENEAFQGCRSLEYIEIPNSVTVIGERAFQDCDSLTIQGKSGSYVETYCKENGLRFKLIF